MKWSMDTHKYISEITRTALEILMKYGINPGSDQSTIDLAEKELATAGVYKNYDSAKGRIRRALLTYFKAYGCLDASGCKLTEVGDLYMKKRISVREFSFYYITNYTCSKDGVKYYPLELILTLLRKLKLRGDEHFFLNSCDFSKIVECDSVADVTDSFVDDVLQDRYMDTGTIDERAIGYDLWAKMLVQSGIMFKDDNRRLRIRNYELFVWLLDAYSLGNNSTLGDLYTGVLRKIPYIDLTQASGDFSEFKTEGKALQAYLFDGVEDSIIEKYIFSGDTEKYKKMLKTLGIINQKKYYESFLGLERLVGYILAHSEDDKIKKLGQILTSIDFEDDESIFDSIPINYDLLPRKQNGKNILLYGVPGSGKSWTIDHEYCFGNVKVERLVFHPDYTYSDFVGQILPAVGKDGQVSYKFTPGPFTNILSEAYKNPQMEYVLVIEEINRGNAPAIFGDVFQLLDRKVEVGFDGLPIGTSDYGITNANIATVVYGNTTHKVRIPSNLSIIGTMNTSDQNVFTLDTAFQRRWQMRLIENNFENVRDSLADAIILDTDITWKQFCTVINKLIVGNKVKMASAEDKRLGVYFVHENDLRYDSRADSYGGIKHEYNALLKAERENTIANEEKVRLNEIREALMQNRIFPAKVIKYLWDDAFKFNPEAVFDVSRYESLEDIISDFLYSTGSARLKIFNKTVRDLLSQTA